MGSKLNPLTLLKVSSKHCRVPLLATNLIELVLQIYFDGNSNPTLANFVAKNLEILAKANVKDIKQYWTGQYKRVAASLSMPYVRNAKADTFFLAHW